MQLRIGGRRDDRRRRVLLDEGLAPPDGAPAETARPAKRSRGRGRTYSDGALDANQPPWTAWLPTRRFSQAVVLLGLLTAVAGLLAAYGRVSLHVHPALRSHWRAFDLEATGNLAQWFAALLLAACAVLSTFIYRLRRHRLDDYRGRYRLWLWTSVLLWIASMDAGAGLHQAAGAALRHIAGRSVPLPANVCGLLLYFLPATVLVFRLAMEMWHCRLALAAVSTAIVYYGTALLLTTEILLSSGGPFSIMLGAAAALLGHVCLLATGLFYARYVYCDAHGRLPLRESSKKAASARRTKKEEVKADANHGSAPAAAPAPAPVPSRTFRIDPAEADEEESSGAGAKISKAERRKLRKQRRREAVG